MGKQWNPSDRSNVNVNWLTTVYIAQRQPRAMIKSMSIVCETGTFPLGGGWRIPDICRESSRLASCGSSIPGRHTTTVSIPAGIQGEPDKKRGRNWVEPIVWMLKPTLVNTESSSTRLLESKDHLRNGKSRGKCEDERQQGALVHSLRSR